AGSVVVAMRTSSRDWARRTRLTTRASIGSPARSSRTLPGRRLLPIRAWMMATIRGRWLMSSFPQRRPQALGTPVHVLTGHGGEQRPAQAAGRVGLGPGEVALAGADVLGVPGLQVHGDVMPLAADVAGRYRVEDPPPSGRTAGDLRHQQVV